MAAEELSIPSRSPESQLMVERVATAIDRCERLNRIPYADQAALRDAWTELTGQDVDETFRLVPPFRTDHGINIRIGRTVFINHDCTLNDIGGITIGDETMLGPHVSLLTSGHPVEPDQRRSRVTAAPIVIGRNVWIGAGATVVQGVTVGDDSVIAAGAVVTVDVPAATVVAGVPARVIREL